METLDNFMERLASSSPAPGGGAASGMVAIVGASLTSMVAGLTIGKKGYEEHQPLMEKIQKRSNEIQRELRELMQKDEEAFNQIVKAWKMPKATEDEKRARQDSLIEAAKEAISVPWKIASAAQEILRISAQLVDYGNKNAITDAGCSLEFSMAAMKGALQNIKINLKSLKDENLIESERMKMKFFLEDSEQIFNSAMKVLEGKL